MSTSVNIITGDCREAMATLPDQHFHCVVTSPPYFNLRSYSGGEAEIGQETTPDDFVAAMREVFGGKDNPVGVWRILRDNGCLFLNLGDSYCGGGRGGNPAESAYRKQATNVGSLVAPSPIPDGLKPKDLIGIPWRVAFALQADGYYLRDAIVWHKPAPMPGSQRDRCTSSYEFVFQLTKSARYYFDMEAIKEPSDYFNKDRRAGGERHTYNGKCQGEPGTGSEAVVVINETRTPRNVWKIAHEGYSGAHFATMPVELATRCIKASTSERGCCSKCGAPWERVVERDRKPTRPGDNNISDETGKANRDEQRHVTETRTTGLEPGCKCDDLLSTPCRVFDPFSGVGTTGVAARTLGRHYTGIELNAEYAAVSRDRIARALNPSTHRSDDEEHSSLFNRKAASNP
jgi:DNA modification methylase